MEWNDGERAKLNWSSNYNDQKRHRNQVQLDIIAVSRACEISIILDRTFEFFMQFKGDYDSGARRLFYTEKFFVSAGCNAMSEFFT